jgi:hypothetical protein
VGSRDDADEDSGERLVDEQAVPARELARPGRGMPCRDRQELVRGRRLGARHDDLVPVSGRRRDENRGPVRLRRSAVPAEWRGGFDHLRLGGSAAGDEARERGGQGERDPPDHNSIVEPGVGPRKRSRRRGKTSRQDVTPRRHAKTSRQDVTRGGHANSSRLDVTPGVTPTLRTSRQDVAGQRAALGNTLAPASRHRRRRAGTDRDFGWTRVRDAGATCLTWSGSGFRA